MKLWTASAAVAAAALIVVLVSGCGGGGSPATDWARYTPPAQVVPVEQQQEFAVSQTVEPVGSSTSEATGPREMIEAGTAPIAPVVEYTVQESGLSGYLPVQVQSAGGSHPNLVLAIAKLMRGAIAQSAQSRPAQENVIEIDWTDPVTGIHWTGSFRQVLTGYRLDLHGEGPNTDVTVTASINVTTLSSATASLAIEGSVAAEVDLVNWQTGECEPRSGRAILNDRFRITATTEDEVTTAFNGTCSVDDRFEVLEDDQWVTKVRQEGSLGFNGTLTDETGAASGEFDLYFGVEAGEELFWAHHTGSVEAEYDLVAEEGWIEVTHDVELSNGMTGHVAMDRDGNLDGWIRDADGELLATITGNLYDGTGQIIWTDGTIEPINPVGPLL